MGIETAIAWTDSTFNPWWGCTDDCACDGGCSWIEPDLCSSCADALAARAAN
jgi:protein gp37